MCFSTARLVSTSDSEIAALLLPSAIAASTSSSRGVSWASGERSLRALAATSTSTTLGSITERPSATASIAATSCGAVVHALLEQVGAAVRARLEQREDVRRVRVLAEHDDADVRVLDSRSGAATRIPSSVFVGGMRMSVNTTSGRPLLDLAQQRVQSAHSASTSISGAPSSTCRSPSRTM